MPCFKPRLLKIDNSWTENVLKVDSDHLDSQKEIIYYKVNSLPNDKSKLKALAQNNYH